MTEIRTNADIVVDLLKSINDPKPSLIREAAAALITTDRAGVIYDDLTTMRDHIDPNIAEYLEEVVGVVEATRDERHSLWRQITRDGANPGWDDRGHGWLPTVGTILDMPICISLERAKVRGHHILFYHATSRVVDHNIIRAWLDKFMPASARKDDGRLNHSDAANFHNVLPRGLLSDAA